MKTIQNISRAARKAKKAQARRRNDWMPGFARSTDRLHFTPPSDARRGLSAVGIAILKSILGRKTNP